MSELSFDHVHLVSPDPHAAANWYVDKLGAKRVKEADVQGAPQIYLSFGGPMVIIRGRRTGEEAIEGRATHGIVDHFALRVAGDFFAVCERLRVQGVPFTLAPKQFNPTTSVAFITAPDGVSIEILHRTDA